MKMLRLSIVLLIFNLPCFAQSGQLEVWIRSFIPNVANAGSASSSIVAVPGSPAKSMVKTLTYCFLTDNRGFSTDPTTTSRMETKFVIAPNGTSATITPSGSKTKLFVTSKLDCSTGVVIETKQGTVNLDAVGNPAIADGWIQVIGQSAGTNVLTFAGNVGPSIDYNFDLKWNASTSVLKARINHGTFPALEMYVRRPGGVWVAVVKKLPVKSPLSLAADAFGLNTVIADVTVNIPK